MEKIIKIDGHDVPFKSTGGTMLRYKNQTNRELLDDLNRMSNAITDKNVTYAKIDTGILYDIIWVFAKTANPDIPPVEQWLDTFEVFPLINIFSECMELITSSLAMPIKNV